jgi:hypothetical protein
MELQVQLDRQRLGYLHGKVRGFFLAGRTSSKVDALARKITAAGGTASAAHVDALDETAVDQHLAEIARRRAPSTFSSTPSAWKTFKGRH